MANWKLFDVGPLMSVAQDVVIASFVAAVFAKALRTSADLFKRAPSVNDSLDAARAAAITGAITLAVGSPMILFWHSAPFKAALAGSLSRNRVLAFSGGQSRGHWCLCQFAIGRWAVCAYSSWARSAARPCRRPSRATPPRRVWGRFSARPSPEH